jgi:peptidoglycan hydrolase CwlO-like protein
MNKLSVIITICILLTTAIVNTVLGEEAQEKDKPVIGPVQKSDSSSFRPADIDPELVRKSMQARSEYDKLTRKITERKKELYRSNAEIKEYQEQIKDLQNKIDKILTEDKKLIQLKKEYKTTSPELPGALDKNKSSDK